jgi:hypothetical protein
MNNIGEEAATKANTDRSIRGGSFEQVIQKILESLKTDHKIKRFEIQPNIFGGEFKPDFIVEKNSGEIISLDATTTARSDRLRAKQWDAYGTKLFYKETKNIEIKSYVVVQDIDTNSREINNFRLCKNRSRLSHSALDGTVSVEGMVNILTANVSF